MAKVSCVLVASFVLVFAAMKTVALPLDPESATEFDVPDSETNLGSGDNSDEFDNPPVLRHFDDDYEDEAELEDYVEVESPYKLVDGQWWVLNVWQWLLVSPQHVVYVAEPHLPWYGNLIKWLRINVLFKPIY